MWKYNSEIEKYLRKYLWKSNKIWSSGSFISTIGEVSEETVKKYIEAQG
jgi:putative transposase